MSVRLRQVVLAASELEPTVAALREALGLGDPYADPGVGLFGLRNAVMALGDQFVEVVSPVGPDTAAGRFLDRRGGADGGYMLILQVDDLGAARRRAAGLGVRVAWEVELDDIATVHLHPAGTGGTLLSLDRPAPPESWRWAGPEWTGRAPPAPDAGALRGVTVRCAEPERVAERWGALLDLPVGPGPALTLDGGRIAFVAGEPAGLCGVEVAGRTEAATVGGVTWT